MRESGRQRRCDGQFANLLRYRAASPIRGVSGSVHGAIRRPANNSGRERRQRLDADGFRLSGRMMAPAARRAAVARRSSQQVPVIAVSWTGLPLSSSRQLHAARARRECRHLEVSARREEVPLTNSERYRAPSGSPVMPFFAWPGCARTSSGGIEWLASAGSRGSQSYLGPCAKHPLPLRQQAMTMHLSRRDEHRVMEAMADMSLVTKGQQPARANGDCGVGGARGLGRGQSSNRSPRSNR